MSTGSRLFPPRQVPTLTEVVVDAQGAGVAPLLVLDARDDAALAADAQRAGSADVPAHGPVPEWAEQQLAQRVLADVQRQIDLMLEQRLREMLAPALARWSEALIEDSREQLALVLRDVVAQAVAREFDRQRRR